MKKKLSDYLIVSDVDWTLMPTPGPIPARNLEALEYFTEKGGRFCIASGRPLVSVRRYIDLLPVNAPCIVFNGSAVYDYAQHRLYYARYLPGTFAGYVQKLIQLFPQIGFAVYEMYQIHALHNVEQTRAYMQIEGLPIFPLGAEELTGDYFKLLMAMPEELVGPVSEFVRAQCWDDVEFVTSGPNFLEMLPKGSNKGEGIRQLSRQCGILHESIVAIGDYYNDFEMLRSVSFPVTVAGAPDDIKAVCKLVTGPCENGALADLVEYLEAYCG